MNLVMSFLYLKSLEDVVSRKYAILILNLIIYYWLKTVQKQNLIKWRSKMLLSSTVGLNTTIPGYFKLAFWSTEVYITFPTKIFTFF